MAALENQLICPLCAQAHRNVDLQRGEQAECVRCGALLAKRSIFGDEAPLAFTVTALVLAVPSCVLPFVTLSKFGNVRISYLISGVEGLWRRGMPSLAVWALFCGIVAPLLELVFLAALLGWRNHSTERSRDSWVRAAHHLQHWAMPEVHVLAVLVAFFKIGDLAQASVQTAFYCYCAAGFATLLAWRGFTLEPAHLASARLKEKEP